MNTEILAQIFTNYRQTKREHAAYCRAWWACKLTVYDGKVFVPASYLRDLVEDTVLKTAEVLKPS